MLPQYFNKDFAKQFRSECDLYCPAGEFQYGKILVRSIKNIDAKMPETAHMLADHFFNTGHIDQILLTLRNSNLPIAEQLYTEITGLMDQLESYVNEEPYTAHFYNDCITMLHSFSELINAFYRDFSEQVYSQLNKYYTDILGTANFLVADSSSLSEIISLTEFYLKNLLSYYNYFIVTWQYEENNGKGIQLTTYMADHLQLLIVHIEETLESVEKTRTLLLAWEQKMEILETQEIYN